MLTTDEHDLEVYAQADRWEMQQVLEDKPAFLSDVLPEEEVLGFANQHKLVYGWKKRLFDDELGLVIAQDKKALDRVLEATTPRELGLALGYEDIGVPAVTPPPAAEVAPRVEPEAPPVPEPVEEAAVPPEVLPSGKDVDALKSLGYTDTQIRRMRAEDATRVVSEQIAATQVSVLQDGTVRLLPETEMPSKQASAYEYKTAEEHVADVKQDVKEAQQVEIPPGEAGFIRIPTLKDFSEVSDRFKTGIRKLAEPQRDIITDTYGAIEKWRSETNKAGLYADWAKDSLRKIGKKSEAELVVRWIDNPEKYQPEYERLPINAKALADALRKDYQDMWNIANELNILEAWRENYINRIYRDRPERVRKALYPAGGRLGTKPGFARLRTFETLDEAETAGLHPILDPALLNSVYKYQLYRTIANRNLIQTLSQMEREDGMPMIMGRPKKPDKLSVWEQEYEWVNVPALSKYMWVGEAGETGMLVKIPAKADPEVAKALNNAFAPWATRSAVSRGFALVRGRIKRVIMYNPLIHSWNIASDVLDEMNFNPYSTAKTFVRGGRLYKQKDALVERAIAAGLETQTARSVAVDLRKELMESSQTLRGVLEPIGKLEQLSDKWLWQKIVRNAQLGLFETLTQRIAKHQPTWSQEQVDKVAATYINTLLGTLPHTWMSSGLRKTGSIGFFARNWTFSNIDMVVKAATMGRKGLGMKALSPEEQTRIGKDYSKHLVKGIIGLLGMANLGQIAFLVITNKMKDDGILDGKPVDLHTTFENEKGHWMDIDTGLDTKTGQRIYLVAPLFRYMRDYIGWGTQPLRTVYNKLEPMLKTAAENVFNYSVWQRQEIDKPGAPTLDRIKQRAWYFVQAITPSAVYARRPGRPKTKFEYFIPFTGTWIRRGAPGGRFSQLFFEFQRERGYKEDKVEKEIDDAFLKGEFPKAIEKMGERYISNEAKADRITRLTTPLNYYMEHASRKEQMLFMEYLKKHNYTKDDLYEAMAEERMAIENRGD